MTGLELNRPEAVAAADAYAALPRPLFTRLPASYRYVPIGLRTAALSVLSRRAGEPAFPRWPIEPSMDPPSDTRPYAGRRAAVVITHDVDSREELDLVDGVRALDAERGLASSFGFVPRVSWPEAPLVERLVRTGAEVYWHDLGHDGRLPYLAPDAIRRELDAVAERSPWAMEQVRTFRAGQLLVSDALVDVVAERFAIDMSIPDTERGGPYGGVRGCGTVRPFRWRGMLELPATMPQDVFLRHVYRLTPPEIDAVWTAKLAHIVMVGGVAVINIHPRWIGARDPDLRACYLRLLDRIAADPELLVTTPAGLERAVSGSAVA